MRLFILQLCFKQMRHYISQCDFISHNLALFFSIATLFHVLAALYFIVEHSPATLLGAPVQLLIYANI